VSAVGHSLLLLLRVPVIVCDQISVLAHKQGRGVRQPGGADQNAGLLDRRGISVLDRNPQDRNASRLESRLGLSATTDAINLQMPDSVPTSFMTV
jgi:hypothetical protein